MKYIVLSKYSLFVLMICSLIMGQQKTMEVIPEKPQAGKKVLIKFNAIDTKLASAESLKVLTYSIVLDTIYSSEHWMNKSADIWEYKYTIPQSSWSIGLKFTDGETEVDDNGYSYPVFLYDEDGQLLKGTKASYASTCLSSLMFLAQPGASKAYSLFKEEFETNPELTKYFLSKYLYSIGQEKPDGWKETIKNVIEKIEAQKEDLDEKAFYELWYTYLYLIKDKEKAEECNAVAISKYPLGYAAQAEAYNQISRLNNNVDELEKAVLEYRTKFGDDTIYSTTLWKNLFVAYCENNMYSELKEFLIRYQSELNNLSIMNSISAEAKVIAEEDNNFEFAKYLIDYSLEILDEYTPSAYDFHGDTETQREFKINGYKSRTLHDAACVYEKAGEPENAFMLIEKAYLLGKPTDDVKIMYAELLVELNKDADKALAISEELILESKVATEITDLNKAAYTLSNGSNKGYNEYFYNLRKPLLNERKEEIKAELFSKPSPDFSLKDVDGNIVMLSSLKGKIVILDFWATWCMPCKASMPLMKDAVEKYAGNDDIEFFFVDTFERGEESDVSAKAKKFMEENNYPFHVLLDTDGKLAKEGYGIATIPSKIFIDKNANWRFTSVGFDKSKLLDEIDILIELLKE